MNPFSGVIVRDVLTLCPPVTLKVVWAAAIVKPGAAGCTIVTFTAAEVDPEKRVEPA